MDLRKVVIVLATCAAAAVFAALALFFLSAPWRTAAVSPTAVIQSGQIASAGNNTSVYRNDMYDFVLAFPSDLSVHEYDEGEGTRTIAFEKEGEPVGFQMFITPDPADPITLPAIQNDFPGLEMQGTESLTIGTGTPALAFASSVQGFGSTSELWFAHDGYLFEITTYPNLGAWLAQIIDTTRFP
jgi:hypothetical protein